MGYKSGFVGIIGRPNVGKSTLLNAILGEKIAIISDKPQTTRNQIRGVYTTKESQTIFIDTPGIHKPKNALGEYMTSMAERTLSEVDIVLCIVDERADFGPGDKFILEMLEKVKTPKILLINKIDLIEPDKYREIYEAYDELGVFEEIMGISAIDNKNVDALLKKIGTRLPEGPQYFPEDIVTDQHERFIAGEIIREKTLLYLKDEIPHGIAVEISSMKQSKKVLKVEATIYCEKKSHKGIIIGKDGRKLKGIGQSAREEIESLLGTQIYLELWVKVRDKWRESESLIKSLGYKK